MVTAFHRKYLGKIEVFNLNETGQEKVVRTIDIGCMFGKKEDASCIRYYNIFYLSSQDSAKSVGESIVLEIDKAACEKIRANTVVSEAEQKINFLLRYVPKLRMSPRNIIEELEILFVKETYTKGYKIIKEGELNENVYFIQSGNCRTLIPISGHLSAIKAFLLQEAQPKYIIMHNLSI
jgi:CRP-like cAMP-binding protein